MSVSTTAQVNFEPFAQQDPRDPFGVFFLSAGVGGDASGGTALVEFQWTFRQRAVLYIQLLGCVLTGGAADKAYQATWRGSIESSREIQLLNVSVVGPPVMRNLWPHAQLTRHLGTGTVTLFEVRGENPGAAATLTPYIFGYIWDGLIWQIPGGPRKPLT